MEGSAHSAPASTFDGVGFERSNVPLARSRWSEYLLHSSIRLHPEALPWRADSIGCCADGGRCHTGLTKSLAELAAKTAQRCDAAKMVERRARHGRPSVIRMIRSWWLTNSHWTSPLWSPLIAGRSVVPYTWGSLTGPS